MTRLATSLIITLGVAIVAVYPGLHNPHPAHRPIAVHRATPKPRPQVTPLWHTVKVWVTAYVVKPQYGCDTYTNRTASGARATNQSVAVDTRVFRFGTKFRHLPRPSFEHGKWVIHYDATGVAQDTGGAVEGYHLDKAVYSCDDAYTIGRRLVTVQYQLR